MEQYFGYNVGERVIFHNTDFDAVIKDNPCVVKEIYADHMIITDLNTDTDLWIEDGFNLDCVRKV